MLLIRQLACAAVVAACTLLTACGSSSGSGEESSQDFSSRIHLLAAASGELALDSGSDSSLPSGTLTLNNLHEEALWYADRPGRENGTRPLFEYLGEGWNPTYGTTEPNATLQFQASEDDEPTVLYLRLSTPTYQLASNTAQFKVQVLNDAIEGPLPPKIILSEATLNILNNVQDDREVTSYVQNAAHASLQPRDAGGYMLTLAQASDDVFWVDNAPGTYSDRRPVSQLPLLWSHLFKDTAPNAALVGTTHSGNLRAYFVTLNQPEYDAAGQTMRYVASMPDAFHGALEELTDAVLLIDSGTFSRFPFPGKGTAYQAFGTGYDPSWANTTYIYFGSDIASRQAGSLWGTQSYLSVSCEPFCRNDLKTMKDMGINMIRLYDWEPRNDHSKFLDHAHDLGIKVVVPISNWLPRQSAITWAEQIPNYFKHGNFGNAQGNDWHPAIAGVIISNELDKDDGGQYFSNVIGLMAKFMEEADRRGFSKNVPVGAPVTFAKFAEQPSWHAFEQIVNDSRLAPYRDRLMLCPQTYNLANDLFGDWEGRGKGWVDITWERYQLPILFTEIGRTRTDDGPRTAETVMNQLKGAIEYQKQHPERLLGVMHFQFENKIWKQAPNDSNTEGAFGAFRHAEVLKELPVSPSDYDYRNDAAINGGGTLTINKLEPTVTYDGVVEAYR